MRNKDKAKIARGIGAILSGMVRGSRTRKKRQRQSETKDNTMAGIPPQQEKKDSCGPCG